MATLVRMPEQVDLPKLYQVLAIPLQTALLIVQGTPLPQDAFPAGQMNTALIVMQALLKLCHWRRNGHVIDQSTDFVALLVVPISGPQLSTELRNIDGRGGLRFFHNQRYLAGTTLLTLESPNWFSEEQLRGAAIFRLPISCGDLDWMVAADCQVNASAIDGHSYAFLRQTIVPTSLAGLLPMNYLVQVDENFAEDCLDEGTRRAIEPQAIASRGNRVAVESESWRFGVQIERR